jgi:protoheme IX farnesyltransferase
MTETTLVKTASWHDYYEMCKPRVVMMMVLTSMVGMFLAVPGMVPLPILLWGNIGIALVAGAGAVVNHVIDQRIDTIMQRTLKRPIPQGKLNTKQALVFALAICVTGMLILAVLVNPLCAWLTLASFVGYAIIYTGWLKRATPQNIVIGGLSGAMPPLLGWSAVSATVDPYALLLVLIIFAWTPPHFWPLAIHRKKDYAKTDIPMLPVTHGEQLTKIHTLLYTILMLIVTLLPYLTGMSGLFYLLSALLLGAGFMYYSIRLLVTTNPQVPMQTFRFSIVYLIALFIALLVDHYL